ncbi:hypothetical protein M752DRAFT_286324 [Aspergillus phoenicis ATCC 13157]|uniref:Uncharacterized protein n=1 Tax=Aspergillus phoenicis ATCC 13157 TaxID=1353007 RepID=A0A370P982_ASPPH|nr:hypothetical protein M752DRAFT_286324 [Aspergillus phoenicis ATCC 13157]
MADISSMNSFNLPKQFSQAKKAVIDGKIGKIIVLGVSLINVEMIERGERHSRDMNYTSFAYCFVLAIGREGFRVYQYLKRGAFLKNFDLICGRRCLQAPLVPIKDVRVEDIKKFR